MHQLTFIKYVTTLYKFTDPVSFIDPVQNLSAFSVQWSEGFVYFFVVLGGFGVLALAKINYNPSKKYFQ